MKRKIKLDYTILSTVFLNLFGVFFWTPRYKQTAAGFCSGRLKLFLEFVFVVGVLCSRVTIWQHPDNFAYLKEVEYAYLVCKKEENGCCSFSPLRQEGSILGLKWWHDGFLVNLYFIKAQAEEQKKIQFVVKYFFCQHKKQQFLKFFGNMLHSAGAYRAFSYGLLGFILLTLFHRESKNSITSFLNSS